MIITITLKYRLFSIGRMLLTQLLRPWRLYLFPIDGGRPRTYEFIDYRGGHVNVPAGRYKALCVNSDTESVLYRNTDSFDGFEAYAPEGVLNVGGSPAPRAEGTSGERIAGLRTVFTATVFTTL